jgi:hypothetical protein
VESVKSVAWFLSVIHIGIYSSSGSVRAICAERIDSSGRVLDPAVEKLVLSLATNVMNYIHQNICPSFTLEPLLWQGSVAVAG